MRENASTINFITLRLPAHCYLNITNSLCFVYDILSSIADNKLLLHLELRLVVKTNQVKCLNEE